MIKFCYAVLMSVAILNSSQISAVNSVVVESKSISPGATSVVVGVYVTNDVPIEGAVFPLEIRSLAGGGFISSNLDVTPLNRFTEDLTGYVIESVLPDKESTVWYKCDGSGYKTRGSADYESPEGILFAVVKGINDDAMGADSDGAPPGGTPSFKITFDVTNVNGAFQIDTTCVTPDNHLAFYSTTRQTITPTFTKGVVLFCTCPCWADPQCDGVMSSVQDVVLTVNVAFRGSAPTYDAGCPNERTDVDATGATSVTDVVRVVNVAFRGQSVASNFVTNPCQ